MIIIKHSEQMPHGYALLHVHDVRSGWYFMVFNTITGKFVGKRKHYKNQRAATIAARRSAFITLYNALMAA